tara:strand:+ start:149 stop:802 length:654 start_codon:yes stop_codon:yes gene_type:complete
MYQFIKQGLVSFINRNKSDYYVVHNILDSIVCEELVKEIKLQCDDDSTSILAQSGGGDKRIFNFKSKKYESLLNTIALMHCPRDSWFAFPMVNWLDGTKATDGSGEGWHRDSWFGQRKLLIYLTNCTDSNGPFQYVNNSNSLFSKIKYALSGQTDRLSKEPDSNKIKTFIQNEGTGISFDASGAHRGKPPKSGERLAITFYYFSSSYKRNLVFSKFS